MVRAAEKGREVGKRGGEEKGWDCLRCAGVVWGFERARVKEEEKEEQETS